MSRKFKMIISTIEELERARRKCKCYNCYFEIKQGEIRASIITHITKMWKRYFCKICAIEIIDRNIIECKMEVLRLKDLKKKLI